MKTKKAISTFIKYAFCTLTVLGFAVNATAITPKKVDNIRLYTLNCGYLDMQDMSFFSNTNFYPHQGRRLADPCFLIQHPKGWLLWDTGIGDQYVGQAPFKDTEHHLTIVAPISLASQLHQLGLEPKDIKYIAFSHAHFDHTGNAALFPNATFLMQKLEYDAIQKDPLPLAVKADLFAFLKNKNKILLTGNYDVFGDKTVQILSTPGHTVGHESLEIKLPQHGVIILSGDLYHTRDAYAHKLVPVFNASPAETLASMKLIDKILEETHGRLVVQHDMKDFLALPRSPEYLN